MPNALPQDIQTGIQFKDKAADVMPLNVPAPIFISDQPLDAVVIEATAVDASEFAPPPIAIQTDNPFKALTQPFVFRLLPMEHFGERRQ